MGYRSAFVDALPPPSLRNKARAVSLSEKKLSADGNHVDLDQRFASEPCVAIA
jgi:hypothetical protein